MVDLFDIDRRWWNQPPNAAFEGVAFPCTPIGFDYFQSTHLMNALGNDLEMRPELGLTTWGELFPSSILLRFMRGLVSSTKGEMSHTPRDTYEWHTSISNMMYQCGWATGRQHGGPNKTTIRNWVFGQMYDEATEKEQEGMQLIVEVFSAVSGNYAGVETPIEMGIVNHEGLIEPLQHYNFTQETVIEGMEMLNEKQAFAWTTDGLMV